MTGIGAHCRLAILLLFCHAIYAQTQCGTEHTQPGTFICYPNPAENAADASVADLFHLSAQANAPTGRMIRRYTASIDGHRIYDNRLASPEPRLSIEINLRSPFSSGVHTLTLVVLGADTAEVQDLTFHPAANASFCDPFSRTEARTCLTSSVRQSLDWTGAAFKSVDALHGYAQYVNRYSKNLKALEADIADAVSVDSHGNLYAALHSGSDVELRKYAPNGSLVYDNLVRSCGVGFVSVVAIAADDRGRVWIAGNATACIATTPGALTSHLTHPAQPHGFVILIDTAKPSSADPLYATFLADADNRITGLRADKEGKAYLSGIAESTEFPHETNLTLERNTQERTTRKRAGSGIGFVSVLNQSGSGMEWSTLLAGAEVSALAIDDIGTVYVTGGLGSEGSGVHLRKLFLASLPVGGRRLSYFGTLKNPGVDDSLAISWKAPGDWVFLAGESAQTPSRKGAPLNSPARFLVALQPCATGKLRARRNSAPDLASAPEIALGPALDAAAAAFPDSFPWPKTADNGARSSVSVESAPPCTSATAH